MFTKPKKSEKGFTIIEVMIVLAIAGLILLIVFLAVPALQRNSRNTQRKNDASKLSSLISEYESNNSGKAPANVVFSGSPVASTDLNATSEKFSILDTATTIPVTAHTGTLPTEPGVDKAIILSKATCDGNSPSTAVGSTRSLVVWYYLEGANKTGCIQT